MLYGDFRALGLLGVLVTDPLMRFVQCTGRKFLEMTEVYSQLLEWLENEDQI